MLSSHLLLSRILLRYIQRLCKTHPRRFGGQLTFLMPETSSLVLLSALCLCTTWLILINRVIDSGSPAMAEGALVTHPIPFPLPPQFLTSHRKLLIAKGRPLWTRPKSLQCHRQDTADCLYICHLLPLKQLILSFTFKLPKKGVWLLGVSQSHMLCGDFT